jgi:hypothetical protein
VTLNAGLSTAEVEAAVYMAKEMAESVVHSLLATIDGAGYLTDDGQQIDLVDAETLESLTDGGALHEGFYFYLATVKD